MWCYYDAIAKETDGGIPKAHSLFGGVETQIYFPIRILVLLLIKGY
jgi:hypothetical protein